MMSNEDTTIIHVVDDSGHTVERFELYGEATPVIERDVDGEHRTYENAGWIDVLAPALHYRRIAAS